MQTDPPLTLDRFPKRPIAVKLPRAQARSQIIVAVFSIAFLGLFAWLGVTESIGILRDQRIDRIGVPAGGEVEVHQSMGRAGFRSLTFTMRYRTHSGAQRTAETEIFIFGGIPEQTPPIIKYDPADDSRATVSWAAEKSTDRWVTILLLCGGGLLIIVAVLRGGYRQFREHRLLKMLAARPQPAGARILRVKPKGIYDYVEEYEFEYDALGPHKAKQRFAPLVNHRDRKHCVFRTPLFLSADRKVALALIGAAGQALLLDSSLDTLVLDEAERTAILQAARTFAPKRDNEF